MFGWNDLQNPHIYYTAEGLSAGKKKSMGNLVQKKNNPLTEREDFVIIIGSTSLVRLDAGRAGVV